MAKGKQTPNNEAEKELEAVESAIKKQPKDASNWLAKAAILSELERYDEALEPVEKAIELEPEGATNWLWKGIVLSGLERHDEALEAIEKAIKIKPEGALNWGWKAAIMSDLERHDEALEAIEKAIKLEPEDNLYWRWKGIVFSSLERHDEALEAIEKAIKLEPEGATNWRWKTEILYNLKRLDGALASVEKAIELKPTSGYLYNMKGVILMGGARYGEALSCFDLALQKRIDHLYLFNRGTVLLRLKRVDEAKDSISRARDLVSPPKSKAEKEDLKNYDDVLQELRGTGRGAGERVSWWDWWFTKANKPRCALGIFLIIIVVVCLLAPFVREGTLCWFNCGKDWGTYIVPAAIGTLLLILPVILKVGPQGIEVMPMLKPPEIDISEVTKTIKPRIR